MATFNPENIEKAKDKTQESAEALLDLAEDSLESVRQLVRDNPLLAVAASVGAGILLAALFRRD